EEAKEVVKGKDGGSQADSKNQAKTAEFSEAAETEGGGAAGSIDILLDVNISVTVAIGETEIPVRRLLQVGPGSVLKLDKPVDAPADLYVKGTKFATPADLYVKGTKFATGNIVVVDDQFAVRIKEILGPGGSAAKTPAA
ncbi:MAG: FliM/FliN family flagellar motor switch protein, partial [Planctomycetota bacterium]